MNRLPAENFYDAAEPEHYAKTHARITRAANFIWGLNIVGAERLPETGPYIYAPTHRSHLDPFVAGVIPERPVIFMAKQELWRKKWLGAGKRLERLGAIPIDRENPELSQVKQAYEVIKQDQVLGIFSEGTSKNRGHKLGQLRQGVGRFAVWAAKKDIDCPVLPVGIASERLNRHPGTKIQVHIGERLYPNVDGRKSAEVEDEFNDLFETKLQEAFDIANQARNADPGLMRRIITTL